MAQKYELNEVISSNEGTIIMVVVACNLVFLWTKNISGRDRSKLYQIIINLGTIYSLPQGSLLFHGVAHHDLSCSLSQIMIWGVDGALPSSVSEL